MRDDDDGGKVRAQRNRHSFGVVVGAVAGLDTTSFTCFTAHTISDVLKRVLAPTLGTTSSQRLLVADVTGQPISGHALAVSRCVCKSRRRNISSSVS